ncbi:MAG: hypothetical protein QGF59_00155, partial [Pirellulaceae bacterium]|nr:hypothetical protein [Pirellulaceae bacterium]
ELLSGADWSIGPPVLVWDTSKGKVIGGLVTEGSPYCLAISSDGQRVFVGCSKGLQEFDFTRKARKERALRRY